VSAGLFFSALCACAAPSPPESRPVLGPLPAAAPASFGQELAVVEAQGQGLTFPLPGASSWQRDPRETHSWVSFHGATSSRLLVRTWRHDGIATPEECEREARSWRADLPQLPPADVIEARAQTLAQRYEGQVTLAIHTDQGGSGGPISGYVLGFGGDGRDCLCLAFSTRAAGPEALALIADRLGAVAQTVFTRARRVGIESKVLAPRP
jgi:hypothetical protein